MTCDNVTCPEDQCIRNCQCYASSSPECQTPSESDSSNHSIPYVITGVVIFVVLIIILSIIIWQHLRKKKRQQLAGLQIRQHNIRSIHNAITQMEAANQSSIGLVVGHIDQGIPCPQANLNISAVLPMTISAAEDASPESYQVNSNMVVPDGQQEDNKKHEDVMKNIAEIKTRDYGTSEFANIGVEQILN